MTSFPLEFISLNALLFINIITKNTNQLTEGITKGELLKTLGYCLSKKPPAADQRLTVLNNAWLIITNISNIHEYIATVDMWTQYISENFSVCLCSHNSIKCLIYFNFVIYLIVAKRN